MMRLTPMVKNILLINVVIFLIQSFLNLPLEELGGLRVVFSDEFAPYQFLTYMWLHGSFGHILGNMFAVFIFGPLLEQVWGPKRFLTFYLICGIGAGVLFGIADFAEKNQIRTDRNSFIENPTPDAFEMFIVEHKVSMKYTEMLAEFSDQYYEAPNSDSYNTQAIEFVDQIYHLYVDGLMVGASGAVFGILMAFGMLFPNTQLFLLFPPIPIKAKYLVLFYGLFELYSEFSRTPGDNVAHLAHLGGMLIAYILLKLWKEDRRRFY
ncbi:MAG: rhomboid family intramembrane serine protease [Flammeovirgaceae bacterium]|nr:rhomboid family intramembrane serine protease [Flammeovirgaceae bacterium]MBE62327.1 rhomboid family intramembrane serine protease [Flammeovirgaceae bacterium]MBR06267.1 rhomboid family intramembrane serine protease [Rickettsiales bacterium]HCX23449.1 rhomboid family intramembrane serine protease [Cytophagales bacterium]|tara:strand:+ start:2659 stop:3453 length:795 start_codon:yes stop_codon:yes gene_type:complete